MENAKQATWWQNGLNYFSLKFYYSQMFDFPVRKITVDAGFSCPNIDGTVGYNGCIFCDNKSFSPSRRKAKNDEDFQNTYLLSANETTFEIRKQILTSAQHYENREPSAKYIAYFQPSTNTYAPLKQLELLYSTALAEKNIIGLAVGTRPDVLPDDVLDLCASITTKTYFVVELGLQSIHNKTLQFLNRGHDYHTFLDAYHRLKERNIHANIHLILGLPGETRDDLLATADEIARLRPHSVKLHNLYVPRGTLLAEMCYDERVRLPTIDQYVSYVVDFIERQPEETVIDRVVADGHSSHTIAPSWYRNKNLVINKIEEEFARRNTYQGKMILS
jgi:radical SAM protein (TIGR01212 family)